MALLVLLSAPFAYVIADESSDFLPSLLKDEWYSEGWDQLFYFEDGTFVAVQLSVVNVGFGSRHAGVVGLVVDPDNEPFLLKQSRSHGEWEYSESGLDLKVARHRLSGDFTDYRIRIRKNEGEIDLDFASLAQPWLVGRAENDENDYRYVSFYAPVASASGRYRVAEDGAEVDGAAWTELEDGRGFALRYVNSTGIYDLIRNASHMVSISDADIQPVVYVAVDAVGAVHSSLALFEEGRLKHEAKDFEVAIENRLELAANDQRNIPRQFYVDIAEDDYTLRGNITIDRFLVRFDPVDHLKPLVRTLVKILNTPIQYRYLGRYDLAYKAGGRELRLQGKVLMDHVVMRHARREPIKRGHRR